ncbi:SDR family NAD(P)-dependent oxidoreductase [Lysobacter claricitrinus]|uniref:SDR family NAD(P)-dependent oxidoreductase n=1 Tax=Lysobacter claricitrinus TaxID=3367728 RepID=UPI0037DB6429
MTAAVLVLGATGTVGRAVVAAAVEAGRPVIAVARGCSGLKALEVAHPTADLTLLRASVSGDRGAAKLVVQLRKLGRPVDAVIVAMKGGMDRGRVLDLGVDALRHRLDEDLIPHVVAARHLLPWLESTGEATRYVVVGGPGSTRPWAGYGHRSVTAAALRMLVRVLHDEALPGGVRVQMLHVDAPACTDNNAAHACPQWPRVRAIGTQAVALATAPRGVRIAPVIDFDHAPRPPPRQPPRDADIADARALLESLAVPLPPQDTSS